MFSGCFAIMVLEGERGHHITKYNSANMTHFSESVACVNCMIEVVREQVFMLMLLSKTFAPTHIETEKQINGINNKFQRQTLKPINDICLNF